MRAGEPCGASALMWWWRRWRLDLHHADTPVFFGLVQGRWRKMLKSLAARVGLDPRTISGHSLRIGAATDCFMQGVPYPIIKKHFRWVSDVALRYFQDVEGVDRESAVAASKIFAAYVGSGGGPLGFSAAWG